MDQISPMLSRFMALHPKEIDLSLDRILRLLDRLGNPHHRLPPVIHVAGTNGKGSTCAFLRSILEADGKRVHAYASPHLVRINERFRIGQPGGGKLATDAMLVDVFRRAEEANDGAPITFFEITSAAGYLLFSENPADFLILETGLGGRYDTTNVIDRPFATAISPISFDHERFLGETIQEIAEAKAGIIKPDVPVAIGDQAFDGALDVLVSEAKQHNAPVVVKGQDFQVWEEAGRLVYQDTSELLDLPLPRLPGRHQIQNAGLAIATLKMTDLPLSLKTIEEGLRSAEWPGRMQRLTQGVLVSRAPADADIWLDGGHNTGAGQVIAETIAAMEEREPRPLYMIAGMLNTKDPSGYFRTFEGLVREVFTVPVKSSDAGIPASELSGMAVGTNLNARPVGSVGEALDHISRRHSDGPPRILICGSLYLVGEVLLENEQLPE